MELIQVASFPKDQNVSPLSLYFFEQGIQHEFVEQNDSVLLYVEQAQAEQVVNILCSMQQADGAGSAAVVQPRQLSLQRVLKLWPLTTLFAALGLLGYFIARFEPTLGWLEYLIFVKISDVGIYQIPSSFYDTYIASWQWWRLLTPTFLHFGFFHILFNGLALWEIGRRLETYLGRGVYAMAFLSTALAANIAQYVASGPSIFGGLSGVLFGFVGLIGVMHRRTSHPLLRLPTALYVLLAITLLAGPLGLVYALFGVHVANGAHFGGLAAGVLLGLVLPVKISVPGRPLGRPGQE